MAKLNFGGVEENVVTRDEFPLSKAQDILKNETVAVIGYGVQGPGQALNQKDNGINVIVGQRKNSKSWDKAVSDGFVPGETGYWGAPAAPNLYENNAASSVMMNADGIKETAATGASLRAVANTLTQVR